MDPVEQDREDVIEKARGLYRRDTAYRLFDFVQTRIYNNSMIIVDEFNRIAT